MLLDLPFLISISSAKKCKNLCYVDIGIPRLDRSEKNSFY